MSELSFDDWNKYVSAHPEMHLLQMGAWGALKSNFGWEAIWLVVGEVGTQILFRKLPFSYTLAYIPKGPHGVDMETLFAEVDAVCYKRRAVFLKIEQDIWVGDSDKFLQNSYVASSHEIQPPRTIVVDITGSEDEILARMKQKTRYNIRLAIKKNVQVRTSADVAAFHEMSLVTAKRDQFGVHSREYYQRAYDLFHPIGACELLVAEYEGTPLAGLMIFAHGKRAWYVYGASNNHERNRMPTYLLQWEAMRWARKKGCTSYDLWGVPDENAAVLEAEFTTRSDGLWGVYRFKRGFGGTVKRAVGTMDRVYMPGLYWLYKTYIRFRGE